MRTKPNYILKAHVLNIGLYTDYRKIQKSYYNYHFDAKIPSAYPIDVARMLENLYRSENEENWKECERIHNATKCRKKRLNNRIGLMLQKPCIFVTLTFSNETLANTSEETRHTYVKRYLKSNANSYVANIDYGRANEREHYHALIQLENLDCTDWHKYGGIKVKRVRSANDYQKLSTYIAKLTNHAMKETANRARVIYSR